MIIEKKLSYVNNLQLILLYIAQDKPSAALLFEKELNEKIINLKTNPELYRKSHYFSDGNYHDLIHRGYTIIYSIESSSIVILDIFKWQDR